MTYLNSIPVINTIRKHYGSNLNKFISIKSSGDIQKEVGHYVENILNWDTSVGWWSDNVNGSNFITECTVLL